MNKKDRALFVLKEFLRIMNLKEYEKATEIITATDIGDIVELPSFLKEYIQGTVEENGFDTIDLFCERNYFSVDDTFETKVAIEYVLSADNGNELPLCVRIEVTDKDTYLSIMPC